MRALVYQNNVLRLEKHYQKPEPKEGEALIRVLQVGICNTKLCATSVTPTGIAILRNAGFQEIGQLGKRIAFELDTRNSDAPLAKRYRQILRQSHPQTRNEPQNEEHYQRVDKQQAMKL